MATTLLTLVQRVARSVGIDPSFTTLSDTNETQDIAADIQQAYDEVHLIFPPALSHRIQHGSITTIASTRTYTLTNDTPVHNVVQGSFQVNGQPMFTATPEFMKQLDPDYLTVTGTPAYVYGEAGNAVGVYPVPDGAYTLSYLYGADPAPVELPTDTFALPDSWLRYVEKRARYLYEKRKGFGDAEKTDLESQELLAQLLAHHWRQHPDYFLDGGLAS